VDAILRPGKGGIFDVTVDGVLLFSKHESDRFPNPGEIATLIEKQG
jgi:selT/selW/selH-like putative selenoprotein